MKQQIKAKKTRETNWYSSGHNADTVAYHTDYQGRFKPKYLWHYAY